eukprot:Phypoly_transcript_04161.p4 GENE.Phypoly_transcript_04161~~Phypoly_transcript_04161.p4  ORF type:complete len:102 (-),score=25.18 Phypoly_transcript_04161:1032-1337(-)
MEFASASEALHAIGKSDQIEVEGGRLIMAENRKPAGQQKAQRGKYSAAARRQNYHGNPEVRREDGRHQIEGGRREEEGRPQLEDGRKEGERRFSRLTGQTW